MTKLLESFRDDKIYYADSSHVTCSMLKYLLKSPAHLRSYLENRQESTPAMVFGKAFHCLALEPEKFNDKFYLFDPDLRPEKEKGMTSKINKAWKQEELKLAELEGKDLITGDELDKIDRMCNSLFNHKKVRDLLNTSKREQPFIWHINRMHCKDIINAKGKVDLQSFDFIADIKTTAEFGGIDKFKYDCKKYHYDMQAAFYCDALGLDQFKFIVVGKQEPHSVGIYDVSPEFLESGRRKYLYALDLYEKYFLSCDEEIDSYIEEGIL